MGKQATKQVWTVNLSMTLGTETETVSHAIDLQGDAATVVADIYKAAEEVEEAVKSAARAILVSARGFGIKKGGK